MLAKRRRLETPPGTPSSFNDNKDSNEQKPSLLSLPNEILFKILEDVSCHDRNQVASVCMRLYTICRHPSLLDSRAYKFKNLSDASMEFICGYLPIKTLALNFDVNYYGLNTDGVEKAVKDRPENYHCIDTLEIYYDHTQSYRRHNFVLTRILNLFPGVNTIIWTKVRIDETIIPDVKEIQPAFKNIEAMKFTAPTLPSLVSYLTLATVNLKRLEVYSSEDLEDMHLSKPYAIHYNQLELLNNRMDFKKMAQNSQKLCTRLISLDVTNIKTYPSHEDVINLVDCLNGTISLKLYGIEFFEKLTEPYDCTRLFPLLSKVRTLILRTKLAGWHCMIGQLIPFGVLKLGFDKIFLKYDDWHNLECIDCDITTHFRSFDKLLLRLKKKATKLRKMVLSDESYERFFEGSSTVFSNFDEIFVSKIKWPMELHHCKLGKNLKFNPRVLIIKQLRIDCDYVQKSDDILNLFTQFSEAVAKVEVLIVERSSKMKPELLTALENMTRCCPAENMITDSWRDEFKRIKGRNYVIKPWIKQSI